MPLRFVFYMFYEFWNINFQASIIYIFLSFEFFETQIQT